MSEASRYARVSDDDGEDVGMMTDKSTGRVLNWSEPAQSKKTPVWKYVAAVAVFVALLIPAVGYTSSVMLERRVAVAVQEALDNQAAQQANATVVPSMMGDNEPAADDSTKLAETNEESTVDPSNPYAGKTFELRDCGSNADEARANGCEYDVMMQEWTPPECIDWALSEKFLKQGNWTWFADPEAKETYNETEIAKGNHKVVYVDQSYQRHHPSSLGKDLFEQCEHRDRLLRNWLITTRHALQNEYTEDLRRGSRSCSWCGCPDCFHQMCKLDVWLQNLPHNHMSSVDRLLKL